MRFPAAFMNSLLITVLSMILIVLFAAMAAYVFVRTKYLASRISFGMMLAAMIIPFQALMIPLVSIYGNTLNLLNNRATLIFLNFGFGMGLAVFMYHGAIKSGVPISLEEAALLDGCNKYQTFFMVVFPLLKTMTSTLVVLDVLWLWNDYLMPSLILTKRDLFTPVSYTHLIGCIAAAGNWRDYWIIGRFCIKKGLQYPSNFDDFNPHDPDYIGDRISLQSSAASPGAQFYADRNGFFSYFL